MLEKENVGMDIKMKAPTKNEVKNDVNNSNKKNSNENEKKSIFEEKETVKIDKAKKTIKELEELMEKRIMLKNKKGSNGKDSVTTSIKEKLRDEKKEKENENGHENEECNSKNNSIIKRVKRDDYNFDLGYTVNMECMFKNGIRLNIPNVGGDDPFGNIFGLQRVGDENGRRIKDGSRNYDINRLSMNIFDSENGLQQSNENNRK